MQDIHFCIESNPQGPTASFTNPSNFIQAEQNFSLTVLGFLMKKYLKTIYLNEEASKLLVSIMFD